MYVSDQNLSAWIPQCVGSLDIAFASSKTVITDNLNPDSIFVIKRKKIMIFANLLKKTPPEPKSPMLPENAH